MNRAFVVLLLLIVGGCADKSRGAALNECRLQYDIRDPAAQTQLVPDCMKEKSFDYAAACTPAPDEDDWDWHVATFAFDNPRCYQPVGAQPWLATALSPM